MRLYDYGASPNCYKVRLLLAQLGLDYERAPIDIFGGDTLTDEYGEVNPGRRVPVLETDSGERLAESGAILLHLAEGTDLLPDDPLQRAQVYRWLFFEQSSIYPTVGGLRFLVGTGRVSAADSPKAPSVQALRVLDAHLSEHDFLLGDSYTLADLAVFGYVHVADEGGLEMDRFPAIGPWLDRVREQPGYMNDLEGFPENAKVGASRSIYD
ncbi:MAG: glutathione S-transferase family protein [Solirubrobacterales bacterium]